MVIHFQGILISNDFIFLYNFKNFTVPGYTGSSWWFSLILNYNSELSWSIKRDAIYLFFICLIGFIGAQRCCHHGITILSSHRRSYSNHGFSASYTISGINYSVKIVLAGVVTPPSHQRNSSLFISDLLVDPFGGEISQSASNSDVIILTIAVASIP